MEREDAGGGGGVGEVLGTPHLPPPVCVSELGAPLGLTGPVAP